MLCCCPGAVRFVGNVVTGTVTWLLVLGLQLLALVVAAGALVATTGTGASSLGGGHWYLIRHCYGDIDMYLKHFTHLGCLRTMASTVFLFFKLSFWNFMQFFVETIRVFKFFFFGLCFPTFYLQTTIRGCHLLKPLVNALKLCSLSAGRWRPPLASPPPSAW